jgi:hypothetical protein
MYMYTCVSGIHFVFIRFCFVVKIEFMFAVIVSHLSVISRHEDLLCWNDWSDIKNRSVKSSAFREDMLFCDS